MPLTLENAAALVPGGASPRAIDKEDKTMQNQARAQQPQALKVRVLRAFYYQGKPVEKNSTVELPRVFALEMVAAKKAEHLAEAEKPAAPAAAAAASKDAGADKKGDTRAR